MPAGEWLDLVIELFPVSALVPAGHRLRAGLAGHDAGCFARYAQGREIFRIALGGVTHLDLPVATGQAGAPAGQQSARRQPAGQH